MIGTHDAPIYLPPSQQLLTPETLLDTQHARGVFPHHKVMLVLHARTRMSSHCYKRAHRFYYGHSILIRHFATSFFILLSFYGGFLHFKPQCIVNIETSKEKEAHASFFWLVSAYLTVYTDNTAAVKI